jgi:hypothetical protein
VRCTGSTYCGAICLYAGTQTFKFNCAQFCWGTSNGGFGVAGGAVDASSVYSQLSVAFTGQSGKPVAGLEFYSDDQPSPGAGKGALTDVNFTGVIGSGGECSLASPQLPASFLLFAAWAEGPAC